MEPTDIDNQSSGMDEAVTFMAKVIRDKETFPSASKRWNRAPKCTLKIESTELSYDDWCIPFKEINKATIRTYRSALFFEYAILSIETDSNTHHFGIKYDDYWKGELPFAVERISEDTPFLLVRQAIIVCGIIYVLWQLITR